MATASAGPQSARDCRIMNDQPKPPPPPLPPGDPEAPLAARGSRLGGWVAALVIMVSVAVAMGRVVADKSAGPGEGGTGGDSARLQAEVGARYLVGMNGLLGSKLESLGQSKDTWLAPLEAAAQSPRETLELDIVRHELMGSVRQETESARPAGATADERRDWETWQAIRQAAVGEPGSVVISDDDRKRFEDRHGWFARLALSQGLANEDPARATVLAQARRTFVGSLVMIMGVVGAFGLGCGLATWAVVRFASGREAWSFAANDQPVVMATGGSVWLETFAVYLGVMVLGGLAADVLPPSWTPWPQALAFLGAAGWGAFWPVWRGLTRGERRAGFGLHRGRGGWREIGAGLIGYCAGLPIVAIGVGLTMVLTVATRADASHPLNHLTGVSPLALVFLGVLAAVWAPVVEELFFRGAFYSAWRQRWGRWVSGLATGVIFAAVHPQGWTAIPALGAVGLVLALLREWRGSLIAPMTAHALNNGTLFVLMIVVMR